jgi:hypothetical protein
MSEVKLNLIDAQHILTGTIHGSVADRCVAALSAEPETVAELEAALSRYMKPPDHTTHFACFRSSSEIDHEPWDAGLVIIDLAARIGAAESTYSQPQPEGEVFYHDGTKGTDISILYRVPNDWLFVNSFEAYRWSSDRHRQKRDENPPFDARAILYGSPLLEFIVNSVSALDSQIFSDLRSEISNPEIAVDAAAETSSVPPDYDDPDYEAPAHQALSLAITNIHANWLLTPRGDLRGKSPRQVMLEKQDFIDFDLHTRSLQWTYQGEGPPCLAPDSFAYRFAGFGTHEWVVYYDLVRHLLMSATELWSAPARRRFGPDAGPLPADDEILLARLEELQKDWLEQPQRDYDGRVPAIIIDNERKRLPQAISAAELIIDDDCEICRMSALHAEMGFGPGFWHLDGCNMDDAFAFSHYLTVEEWEAENLRREEFNRKFELEWAERQQRIARGEIIDDSPLSDPF